MRFGRREHSICSLILLLDRSNDLILVTLSKALASILFNCNPVKFSEFEIILLYGEKRYIFFLLLMYPFINNNKHYECKTHSKYIVYSIYYNMVIDWLCERCVYVKIKLATAFSSGILRARWSWDIMTKYSIFLFWHFYKKIMLDVCSLIRMRIIL